MLGSRGCLLFGPSLGLPLPPTPLLSPSGRRVKAAVESLLPRRRRFSRGWACPPKALLACPTALTSTPSDHGWETATGVGR